MDMFVSLCFQDKKVCQLSHEAVIPQVFSLRLVNWRHWDNCLHIDDTHKPHDLFFVFFRSIRRFEKAQERYL